MLPLLLLSALAVASAQDFKLYGVNYNIRAGPDWAPPNEKCKSADTIQKELAKLKTITERVRLYSLTDCDQATAAVPAVIKAGLKLELGLWVGPEKSVFEAERDKLKTLLQDKTLLNSSSVVSIHVGSEAIYRKDVDVATSIDNFNQVKKIVQDAGLNVPVSIGDIGDTYLAQKELFKAVDFVSANMFPFWEKIDSAEAGNYFYKRYKEVEDEAAKYNKTVVIGETGWATGGVHSSASKASPEDAAKFFTDFYNIAVEHKLQYYYFAGFDEAWKLHTQASNATVEGYFGLFTAEGELKKEYAGLKLDSVQKKGAERSGDDAEETEKSAGGDADEAEEVGNESVEEAEDETADEAEEDETEDEADETEEAPKVKKITVKIRVHQK